MSISISGSTGISGVDGSASTPAIQGSDTNTGISFGTDTVNINTGGTTRATVDSSGRFGVGTTSPSYLLDVNGIARISSYLITPQVDVATNTGIYSQSANTLQFQTNNSERGRIDSSGRLLIGTLTARSVGAVTPNLQIEAATDYNKAAISLVNNNSSDNYQGAYLSFGRSRGGSLNTSTLVQNNDLIGSIRFAGADGTDLETLAAEIRAEVDGTPGTNDMPGRLVFSTTADGASSPTERMRLHSNGRLSISHAPHAASHTLDVRNNETSLGALGVYQANTGFSSFALNIDVNRATTSSSYGFLRCIQESATTKFHILDSGTAQNATGTFNTISDLKLKENIVDAPSQWDDIRNIRIRNYNFKPETNHQTHKQIGVVAQELELVCPGLVEETPDLDVEGNDLGTTTKGVKSSILYMKAVKALQEAMERIESLEARLTTLEGGAL